MAVGPLLLNGRYEVGRRLGEGGTGQVRLARDRHQGGRIVALKMTRSGRQDPGVVDSFRAEFRSMTHLRHPNLAEVFDYGTVTENGRPFLTMEYVEGRDLATRRGRAALAGFDALAAQCLRALDYIHARGYLHNDIKPQNILLAEPLQVKLLDFGLAQQRTSQPFGAVSGTLHYVAPERLAGGSGDPRSDLYSLGAVLYEVLTGRPPFEAEASGQVVTAILEGRVPAPRGIDAEIPERLESFVLRLMERRPEDRPASAGAALGLLNAGLRTPLPLDTAETIASFVSTGDFVGREQELKLLLDLAAARHRGTIRPGARAARPSISLSDAAPPRLALVTGPEGSGKSRLLRELRNELQLSGTHVLAARCFEPSCSPLQPFGDLLRQAPLLGPLSDGLEEALEQAFGDTSNRDRPASAPPRRAGGRAKAATTSESASSAPPGAAPSSARPARPPLDKAELTSRLADCLDRLAGDGGGILLLEDLQWAAAPAIEILRHLLARADGSPWLVIGTLRDDAPGSTAASALLQRLGTHPELRLQPLLPLTEEEIGRLIESMLPWSEPPRALATRLLERTRGNPLYIEETMKALALEGFLERRGEAWGLRTDAPESLPVAEGLAALVLHQVGSLPEAEAVTARLLAVIGRPVPLPLLARALSILRGSGPDEAKAEQSAESLERLQVATIDRQRVGPPLVSLVLGATRTALYDDLTPALRADLHRAAGRAIEAEADGATDGVAEELAHHFDAAGEAPQAASYLVIAARRAASLFDPVRRSAFLRRALDLLPAGDERRLPALDDLALVTMNELGDHRAGLDWALRLEREARRPSERVFRIRGLKHQAWALGFLDDERRALGRLKRALAMARAASESREIAACLSYLGVILSRRGRHEEARAHFDEAVSRARAAGDTESLAWILNNAALCHLGLGDLDVADALLREVLDVTARHGLHGARHRSLANAATVRLDRGDLSGAIQALEESLAWARRHTILETIALQSASLMVAWMLRGRFDRAFACGEESDRARRRMGDPAVHPLDLDLKGQCLRESGRFEPALEAHRRGIDLARQRGDRIQEGYLLASLATDLAAAGKSRAAMAAARDARRIGTDLGHARIALLADCALARTAVQDADRRKVADLRRRLEAQDERSLRSQDRLERRLALSRLALASGRFAEAADAARAGLEKAAAGGFREHEWRLLAAQGEALSAGGLPGEAASAYHDALDVIQAVGAEIEESAMRDDYLNHPERREVAGHAPSAPAAPHGAASDASSRMLQTLFEITQSINTIHEPQQLLDRVLDLAIELVGAERGLIFMARGEGGEMDLVVARNVERRTIKDATEYSRSILREAGRGRSILSHDAGRDARFRGYKSVAQFKIRSLMCVPLSLQGRVLGTVYLDTRAPGVVFTPDSLRFLEAFASQAAVAVENARLFDRVRQENETLRQAVKERYGFESIVGRSAAMRDLFDLLARVAPSGLPVMIRGESGTGKELVARAIHLNSPRRDRPFYTENCAALPDTLLESELFGHVKGAYTGADSSRKGLFELADGGTLFLDEVGDTSMTLQSKLLRVLQNGEVRPLGSEASIRVNVRILSATNRELEAMVREKKFREDLYYRLKGIAVTLPPLRERREDIPLLADHFLTKLARENGSRKLRIDPLLLAHLSRRHWSGNVRELENQIYRLALFASGDVITLEDARHDYEFDKAPLSPLARDAGTPLNRTTLRRALSDAGGNRNEAARLLGISRATLFRKIRQLGL
ncbi:MAG TPA: sigma 54-interacting transcriptional regulator [Candidatus Cryosericum sp.]|nr:sigma 54-interacting transcriptional regulator [Candidatus Cryosericum sp.]